MTIAGAVDDSFPRLLAQHAQQHGERVAVREKRRGIWRTLTWRGLADEAASLAIALADRGVVRGAHVAFLGGNRPRLLAGLCAAQWLGAVVVPLYPEASAEEVAAPLRNADVTHVFAEDQEQVDKILQVLLQCPALRCVVYDQDRGMRHYRQPQLVSYAALLQQGRDAPAARRDWLHGELERSAGSDAACLFFTSGTTGPAKGVVLTHAALVDRARAVAVAEGLGVDDATLAYLPPAWIGQHFFGYALPMVTGCCVCCPESSDTMLADLREIGPTYFLATPRVLQTLATQVFVRIEDTGRPMRWLYRCCMALARRIGARILDGEPVGARERIAYAIGNALIYGPLRDVLGMSRLRVAYATGEAVGPEMLMFYRSIGINLKQLYGSTETAAFVALQRDNQVKPDTVGTPAPGVEVTFTEQREILVRSPGLFKEYHRDADATTRARNGDGWFHTGDTGYLGDDGHLRIIDRLQHVGRLSDGTLHAPRLVENKLRFSPYVREAVVFGDGQASVCALIDIDTITVGRWADRRELAYTGHADLASRPEVHALIAQCIAEVNAELAVEPVAARNQIHRFVVLQKGLDADDGLLTRTGKLRRDAIAERCRALIDAMHAGHDRVRVDSAGADAGVPPELAICGVQVFAARPEPAR